MPFRWDERVQSLHRRNSQNPNGHARAQHEISFLWAIGRLIFYLLHACFHLIFFFLRGFYIEQTKAIGMSMIACLFVLIHHEAGAPSLRPLADQSIALSQSKDLEAVGVGAQAEGKGVVPRSFFVFHFFTLFAHFSLLSLFLVTMGSHLAFRCLLFPFLFSQTGRYNLEKSRRQHTRSQQAQRGVKTGCKEYQKVNAHIIFCIFDLWTTYNNTLPFPGCHHFILFCRFSTSIFWLASFRSLCS